MSDAATYLVDGKRLSADQCRTLFAGTSLLDRQIKVLERIEGETIVDVCCYISTCVREASRRFPYRTVISIDCVTLQEVLEHLEGAALAIKEVNGVLKQGGVLVVSVPNPFYVWRIATFVGSEISNAFRRWRGRATRLGVEVLSEDIEWDRHIYAWTH